MVFTTCIYNNIGYEYKTPHNIDTNSYLFILIFMLHCMLNFSKRFIKISIYEVIVRNGLYGGFSH